MANYVTNIITAPCIGDLDIFTITAEGREFDFSKLKPRPASLSIESGSRMDPSLFYFITERGTLDLSEVNPDDKKILSKYVQNMFSDDWLQEISNRVKAYIAEPETLKKSFESLDEMYDMGKQYYTNIIEHGHPTWYDWNLANWGSKWGSTSSYLQTNDILEFDTAWSAPVPIVIELSKKYPEITFTHIWADEDMGSNTGRIIYIDGEIVDEFYPDNGSHDAYLFYIECNGPTEYLRLNTDGEYEYTDPYEEPSSDLLH